MLTRPASRTTGIAVALLAVAIALTGCTSSAPKAATTHSVSATVPGLPAGVSQATALPTDIPNDAKTRANVQLSSCAATKNGWKASGIVRNPGKATTTTVITVFFTTDKATVISSAQVRATAKAGEKQTWTAQSRFSAPKQTLCVLRGAGRSG